jgi:transcriptional regulator with XRE-family HTH domain
MQKFLTARRVNRILSDMKPLSELLAEWREMLKLTPADAARRCEMTRQQWWELESGRTSDPRSSTLQKLAEGTGIPIERLVAASCFTGL